MKVGLYSVSYFDNWNRDGGLTVEEFIPRAKGLGYEAVELGAKRPHATPLDMPPERRKSVRKLIRENGLALAAVATYSRFVGLADEAREANLHWVTEQIRLAADLGAPVVRAFAAWAGVSKRDGAFDYEMTGRYFDDMTRYLTRREMLDQAREGLSEAAGVAEDLGVTLALQNHKPVIRSWRDVLALIRQVGSPALKACIDAPLLSEKGDEEIMALLREAGELQAHSHFGGEFKRLDDGSIVPERDINYPAFVRGLKEIGYEGALTYEFCHVAVGPDGQVAGIDYIDDQVRMAREYMTGLIEA